MQISQTALDHIRHLDELRAKRDAHAREHFEEHSIEKGEYVGKVQAYQELLKLPVVPRNELLALSNLELKDYAEQLREMLLAPPNGKT